MKCHNFLCEMRNKSNSNICHMRGHNYMTNCQSRKRYNRSIAPLLAWWNRSRKIVLIVMEDITLVKPLMNALDKLNNERNSYHGRK